MPQDLYTHLTEVFNRILMHHADDAYDRFEEISALVKQTDLKFKDPKNDFELNAAMSAKAVSEREQWVERSRNLLNEVNDLISSGDKSLLTKDKTFTIPNFAEEAEMLEWAGISFGEENTLRLQKSIKVSKHLHIVYCHFFFSHIVLPLLTRFGIIEIGNHEWS